MPNQEELTLKVWRETELGAYHFEISNSVDGIICEGSGPSPYYGSETLNEHIYERGWVNANERTRPLR